jgi:hypothetical protein
MKSVLTHFSLLVKKEKATMSNQCSRPGSDMALPFFVQFVSKLYIAYD